MRLLGSRDKEEMLKAASEETALCLTEQTTDFSHSCLSQIKRCVSKTEPDATTKITGNVKQEKDFYQQELRELTTNTCTLPPETPGESLQGGKNR